MNELQFKVLVLDSGVGGLTVLKEIRRQLPNVSFDYLGDFAFLPYGGKDEQQLEQRIEKLLNQIKTEQSYSAVVIACNSASTAVLDYLRQQFAVPFVGVVPAIKVAGEMTKNKNIGLLATQGTVERPYTQKLIDDFASDCHVAKLAAPLLVEIAEKKFLNEQVDLIQLREAILPLVKQQVDTCVLGCTHFSWIHDELSQIAPEIRWIDSCDAIARRVGFVLSRQQRVIQADIKDSIESVFMSTCEIHDDLVAAMHNHGFHFEKITSINI